MMLFRQSTGLVTRLLLWSAVLAAATFQPFEWAQAQVPENDIPFPEGTEVSVQTRSATIQGTLMPFTNSNWLSVRESNSKSPTQIPIGAIEAIRALQGEMAKAPVHEEFAGDHHVHEEPLEIWVGLKNGDGPQATVTLRSNLPIGPTSLELVFLGVAEVDEVEGFVEAAPRKKEMLSLPTNQAFAKPLDEMRAGQTVRFEVPFEVAANGQGGVIATIGSRLPPLGEPGTVGPVGVLESAYSVFSSVGNRFDSGSSFLGIKVKQIRGEAASNFMAEPGENLDDLVDRLMRLGATAAKRVRTGGGGGAASELQFDDSSDEAAKIRVSGVVNFTDVSGGKHPVPFVQIEVWDANNFGADEKLAQGMTDASGAYALEIVPPAADNKPDLYVIARATGSLVRVVDFSSGAVWGIDSLPAISDVPVGAELEIDLTASNDEMNHPSNVAFEVYAAIDVMGRYISSHLGRPAPPLVTVRYPKSNDVSNYSNNVIRMGGTDAHDWDNIHHEYGHHLQAVFNISNSPGGSHGPNDNLCDSHGKSGGIRLAWGEGWPTFFSLMVQRELGLGAMGLPNLGDTHYTDVKPNGSALSYDIENDSGIGGQGEGNEIAVQRALWDFYDAATPAELEQLAIPAVQHFDLAVAANAVTFSQFWEQLVANRPSSEHPGLGAILSTHQLAPSLQGPSDGITFGGGAIPTFRWSGTTGCDQPGKSQFQIIFYDNDVANPRFSSPFQAEHTFRPSVVQRDQIFQGANGPIRWVVRARDTTAPQTGDYLSEARTLIDGFTPPSP